MSEERLQEIKDSIEFQYTLAKAKGYDNALLFTNEEELVEEIDRLNNMIERLNNQLQQKDNIIKEVREDLHQVVKWCTENKHNEDTIERYLVVD